MSENTPSSNRSASSAVSEFKAAFTLLPQILKIYKAIQASQSEPQKQQAQIQTAVTELQAQLQHCQKLLSLYPCLNSSPEDQKLDLEAKKQQLRHKCDLLVKYKNLEVLNL